MNFQFTHPFWLLVLLPALAWVIWLGWKSDAQLGSVAAAPRAGVARHRHALPLSRPRRPPMEKAPPGHERLLHA